MGKPTLGDLAEGIVNLPSFFPLVQGDPPSKQAITQALLLKAIPPDQCKAIASIVKTYQGCDKARLVAHSLAEELLGDLEGEDFVGLKYFVNQILGRQK